MSRFGKKLARLKNAGPGSKPPTASPVVSPPSATGSAPTPQSDEAAARAHRIAAIRKRLRTMESNSRRKPTKLGPTAPRGQLPGEVEPTRFGPLRRVLTHLPPETCHGSVPVRSALAPSGELISALALDPQFAGIDVSEMLLIDTETTGLSGGAGTLAFLIGSAWFEDGALVIEQMLLPQPGHEGPMLHRLAARIDAASFVVSYNGKSFDWPLLRSRFVMNRIPSPELPPHLDLLHCARRVYRKRLKRLRLVDLERALLKKFREDDVDGSLIPAIYSEWLRDGRADKVAGVIDHNKDDLIALAAILGDVCDRFELIREDDDARDHLGFAKTAIRASDSEHAHRFFDAIEVGEGDGETKCEALLLRAQLYRRAKDFKAERHALESALTLPPCEHTADVHLRLAILHEHRTKDLRLAHHHACLAPEEHDDRKRVARIERKATKQSIELERPVSRAETISESETVSETETETETETDQATS